jgi:hypothetical protein
VNFGNGGLGPRNGFQFLKIHAKQFAHRDVVQPNDVFFPTSNLKSKKNFMSLTQSLLLSLLMRPRTHVGFYLPTPASPPLWDEDERSW